MKQRNGSRIAWPLPVSLLIFELALLAACYLEMASARNGIAPFWFSHAILLCGLLVNPPRKWWLYILATVPIRLFIFVPQGTALRFLFAGFATDSLRALLPAWLLRRTSRDHAWFDNLHEFSRYFGVVVFLTPGVFAFAGDTFH